MGGSSSHTLRKWRGILLPLTQEMEGEILLPPSQGFEGGDPLPTHSGNGGGILLPPTQGMEPGMLLPHTRRIPLPFPEWWQEDPPSIS